MLRHAFFVVHLPFRPFIKKLPLLSAKNRNNFETRKFPYYTSYSIHVIDVINLKMADAKENNLPSGEKGTGRQTSSRYQILITRHNRFLCVLLT